MKFQFSWSKDRMYCILIVSCVKLSLLCAHVCAMQNIVCARFFLGRWQ